MDQQAHADLQDYRDHEVLLANPVKQVLLDHLVQLADRVYLDRKVQVVRRVNMEQQALAVPPASLDHRVWLDFLESPALLAQKVCMVNKDRLDLLA